MTSKKTNNSASKRPSSFAALGLAACLVAGGVYASEPQKSTDRGHLPTDNNHDNHHRRSHNPEAMFSRIDKDNSGTITEQEFISAHEKVKQRFASGENKRDKKFDKDGQGVKRKQGARGEKVDMFSRLDTDSDGSISRQEWDQGKQNMKQARKAKREAHFKNDKRRHHEGKSFHHGKKGKRKYHRFSASDIFRAMDSNSDGVLTSQEWNAAHEKFHQRHRRAPVMKE